MFCPFWDQKKKETNHTENDLKELQKSYRNALCVPSRIPVRQKYVMVSLKSEVCKCRKPFFHPSSHIGWLIMFASIKVNWVVRFQTFDCKILNFGKNHERKH